MDETGYSATTSSVGDCLNCAYTIMMNRYVLMVISLVILLLVFMYFMTPKEKFEEVNFSQEETNKRIAEFEKSQKSCSNLAISDQIHSYVMNQDSKRPFGR